MTIGTHSVVWAMYCLLALSVYPSASLAQRLDLDALYAQAAVEGEVSAYLQGPPQVYAGFVREFEAKYPKVKVRITPGRYDLMPKIDAQIAAGRMDADLASCKQRRTMFAGAARVPCKSSHHQGST